jgi:hypothetical protein
MGNSLMIFLQSTAIFMTLGLLAAGSIPPLAGMVYIVCLVLPILLD